MGAAKAQNLPEIFRPDDPAWASRAAGRGEIRRLARGLYTTNLDEPAEQLIARRWADVAALYFPGSVIVDRSAADARPAEDGSLFLDVGPGRDRPRVVSLPGLRLRPRSGAGPLAGDTEFMSLHMSSPARSALENLRPSRARSGTRRTLGKVGLEERLDRLARTRGEEALNQLRDEARSIAPSLNATKELEELDILIGALLGTRDAALKTPSGAARAAGSAYDPDRLALLEVLRAGLATEPLPVRAEPADPNRQLAFFEAYFSNWIEGTEFEVEEAEEIVFEGVVPADRPADAHDVRGTFEVATVPSTRAFSATTADAFEDYIKNAHRQVMAAHATVGPGEYKLQGNRAGSTIFVRPDLVAGTLREGFQLMSSLPQGLPRAIFAMFLVAEVHPFTDGNGRVARLVMNAELSAVDETRVMVPLSYRNEYLNALRALSRNSNPVPVMRMIDRAQRWVSSMTWTDHDTVIERMAGTNALVTPEDADRENLHLIDA